LRGLADWLTGVTQRRGSQAWVTGSRRNAESAREIRPPVSGVRGGDITRFLEPERAPLSGGLWSS